MTEAFLQLDRLSRSFGGLKAVDEVTLQVPEGAVFGVIGPNGAGKTTLFNVISGLHAPTSGSATLQGVPLTGLPQHQIAARGVARTFQNLQIFASMSVLDNVLTGAHRQGRQGLLSSMLHLPGQRREERQLQEQALAALEFVGLADRRDEPAANLPPGQQRLVEIARALALQPRLLLLDEPAAGLTTRETETLAELIRRIAQTGLTTLLIEHDMSLVMGVCQQVAVLEQGRLLALGTPSAIQADAKVVAAYLGEEDGGLPPRPPSLTAGRGEHGNGDGEEAVASRREMPEGKLLLTLAGLNVSYGRLHVLKGVSLHVDEGEVVALLGANGAGKTTVLRAVCGLLRPGSGKIAFDGQPVAGVSTEKLVRLGITQVPEGRQIFGPLSIHDNLLLGAYSRRGADQRAAVQEDLDRVYDLFPILAEKRGDRGGSLSGGQQQMLAMGRALMSRPRLLLLDEPCLGLAPLVSRQIMEIIAQLREQGTTILVVEQNARAALQVADRGYVMETGKIALEGPAEELMRNKDVRRAYLGKDYEEV